MEPIELTDRYFASVRARDIDAFIALFADDAVFVTPQGREIRGAAAIREMELGVFARNPPSPRPVNRFPCREGIAVEIDVTLADGTKLRMANFYHVNDKGLIQRLHVYRQG